MSEVRFTVNKNGTIPLSSAQLLDPAYKVGDFIELGNVINAQTGETMGGLLLVVHDEGISN